MGGSAILAPVDQVLAVTVHRVVDLLPEAGRGKIGCLACKCAIGRCRSARQCRRVSDNATKHALILAGVGWGSLPLWLIERDLAEGRLVRIPAAEFGPQGETVVHSYLMHRVDEPLGPAAKCFRQALLSRIEGQDMSTNKEQPLTENPSP
jgi:DNA-binding transcriptional LysR family regulator